MEALNLCSRILIVCFIFVIACVWKVICRYQLKEKYYKTVLSEDYLSLLNFLALIKSEVPKKILGEQCYNYSVYIQNGLTRYFRSRLDVRVTYSRVTRIKEFFEIAEKTIELKSVSLRERELYWKPIYDALSTVMFKCKPAYFASCYVKSLATRENEEYEARQFILRFYNGCANSTDENTKNQFDMFVGLVNKEIDEYQEISSVSPEIKKMVIQKKLRVHENITTTKQVHAE